MIAGTIDSITANIMASSLASISACVITHTDPGVTVIIKIIADIITSIRPTSIKLLLVLELIWSLILLK